jgi:hypothetical protein
MYLKKRAASATVRCAKNDNAVPGIHRSAAFCGLAGSVQWKTETAPDRKRRCNRQGW